MRNWLVAGALLSLVLVLILAAAALSRFKTYVSENRDWVAARVSDALQRKVSFDSIAVSFHGGLSASVTNLRVADDPRFDGGDFMEVERAHVIVKILPALFGKYEVRLIDLEAPTVRVVRDRAGLNFDSIATRAGGASAATETDKKRVEAGVAVLVSLLRVERGRIAFIDRTSDPTTTIEVEDVAASINGASLTSPIRLDGTATVRATDLPGLAIDRPLALDFAATGVLSELAGKVGIDATDARLAYGGVAKPAGMPLRLSISVQRDAELLRIDPIALRVADANLEAHATASWTGKTVVKGSLPRQPVPLEQLTRVLPEFASLEPTGVMEVEADFAGATGSPTQAHATVGLRKITLSKPGVRIEGLTAEILLDQSKVETQGAHFTVNGSPAEAKGVYEIPSAGFRVDLECRALELKPILQAYAPETAARVDGKIDADLRLAGTATKDAGIRRSLAGNGKIAVQDGVLREINVGEEVLAGATGVHGLTQLISASVRKKHPGLLESADTVFEALGASFRIAGGAVATDDIHVVAPDYTISGRGTFGADDLLDVHAVLEASEELTADFTREVKPAKYLKNANGRLEVPFRLKGVWPQIRAKADESALLRGFERGEIGKQLSDLLGGKRKKDKTPAPEKELLRKGLEQLFRQ